MIIDATVYWYPKHSKSLQYLQIGELIIGMVFRHTQSKKIIAKSYMTNIIPDIGEFKSMRRAKRKLVKALNVWIGIMGEAPYNKPFINNSKVHEVRIN